MGRPSWQGYKVFWTFFFLLNRPIHTPPRNTVKQCFRWWVAIDYWTVSHGIWGNYETTHHNIFYSLFLGLPWNSPPTVIPLQKCPTSGGWSATSDDQQNARRLHDPPPRREGAILCRTCLLLSASSLAAISPPAKRISLAQSDGSIKEH